MCTFVCVSLTYAWAFHRPTLQKDYLDLPYTHHHVCKALGYCFALTAPAPVAGEYLCLGQIDDECTPAIAHRCPCDGFLLLAFIYFIDNMICHIPENFIAELFFSHQNTATKSIIYWQTVWLRIEDDNPL